MGIMGTAERYVEINFAKMFAGRSFTEQEAERARQVAVVGYGVFEALFEKRASIRSGKRAASGPRSTRCSAWSASDPRPAASPAPTISRSFRTPPFASSSATKRGAAD